MGAALAGEALRVPAISFKEDLTAVLIVIGGRRTMSETISTPKTAPATLTTATTTATSTAATTAKQQHQ